MGAKSTIVQILDAKASHGTINEGQKPNKPRFLLTKKGRRKIFAIDDIVK